MSKIGTFNRPTCKAVSEAIIAAVKAAGIEEEYGVSIEKGRGQFNRSVFTMKIECSVVGDDGVAFSQEAEDFKTCAQFHGLKASDLGETFMFRKRAYTVVGFNPKSRKYPVTATRDDGRGFKFEPSTVLTGLGRSPDGFNNRHED